VEKQEKVRLKTLTETLRDYNENGRRQYFDRTMQKGYEVDFYNEVKPFAEKVEATVNEWKPLVLQWIREEKPKYIYPIQINDTCDNLDAAPVLVFQKDARRKRLMEMIKSIDYVLETAEKQLD
jgi:hypothetical protein